MANYEVISKEKSDEGEGLFTIQLMITDNRSETSHLETIINNNPDGYFKGVTSGIVPDKDLDKFYQAFANTFDK